MRASFAIHGARLMEQAHFFGAPVTGEHQVGKTADAGPERGGGFGLLARLVVQHMRDLAHSLDRH